MDVLGDEQDKVGQDGIQTKLVHKQSAEVPHRLALLHDGIDVLAQRNVPALLGSQPRLMNPDDGDAEADQQHRRNQQIGPQRDGLAVRRGKSHNDQKRNRAHQLYTRAQA